MWRTHVYPGFVIKGFHTWTCNSSITSSSHHNLCYITFIASCLCVFIACSLMMLLSGILYHIAPNFHGTTVLPSNFTTANFQHRRLKEVVGQCTWNGITQGGHFITGRFSFTKLSSDTRVHIFTFFLFYQQTATRRASDWHYHNHLGGFHSSPLVTPVKHKLMSPLYNTEKLITPNIQ